VTEEPLGFADGCGCSQDGAHARTEPSEYDAPARPLLIKNSFHSIPLLCDAGQETPLVRCRPGNPSGTGMNLSQRQLDGHAAIAKDVAITW
jgi:hypothetical protein